MKVDDKKLKGSFRTSRNTNYLSSSSRNAKKEDMRRSFNSERRSQSFRGSRISSEEKKDRELRGDLPSARAGFKIGEAGAGFKTRGIKQKGERGNFEESHNHIGQGAFRGLLRNSVF